MLTGCWFSMPAMGEEVRVCEAVKLTTPLKLDGNLDEPCWREAKIADRFFSSEGVGKSVSGGQTSFSILYDEKRLYVGIKCDVLPDAKQLKATHLKRDLEVLLDDCVEIFIDSVYDKKTYFHFAVNSAGTTFEERRAGVGAKDWAVEWEAGTRVDEKSWSAEIAIPFSAVETPVATGGIFGLNVCRRHYAGDKKEFTTWSPLRGEFNQPGKFGVLLWGDYKAAFDRKALSPRKVKWEKEKKEMLEILAGTTDEAAVAELTKKIDGEDKRFRESVDLIARKDPLGADGIKSFLEQTDAFFRAIDDLKAQCYALPKVPWI